MIPQERTDPIENRCEMVLGIHMHNHEGIVYQNSFCINVCRQFNVSMSDINRYCTTLKKEGRLTRHVDDNKRVYYKEA
jgi:hypothetical protein